MCVEDIKVEASHASNKNDYKRFVCFIKHVIL